MFFASKKEFLALQAEHDKLKEENTIYQKVLKEMETYGSVKTAIEKKHKDLAEAELELQSIYNKKKQLYTDLKEMEEEKCVVEMGLTLPTFRYATSEEYKERLKDNYYEQKALIKRGEAIIVPHYGDFHLDKNKSNGLKIAKAFCNNMMNTFNACCDQWVEKINVSNHKATTEKIKKKFTALNNDGQLIGITLQSVYLQKKIEQAQLVYEYQLIREEEKEQRKIQQQILREQKAMEKEIEEKKKKLEKERQHYEQQIESLKAKGAEEITFIPLVEKLEAITEQIEKNDYRLANQKAGYLYIISNPDMEQGMIKIGVTRRLDPTERIDELGNASHSFKFDTHGLVFSEDVFQLEADLHRHFADKRVNLVNRHKEFFYVSLEEVEKVLCEVHHIDIELNKEVENPDYIASVQQRREVNV